MPGLVPGIHVLTHIQQDVDGRHRRSEATPSYGRLCPAMTEMDYFTAAIKSAGEISTLNCWHQMMTL